MFGLKLGYHLLSVFSGQVSSDKDQAYWIGLHDRKGESEFHWLDETAKVRGSAKYLRTVGPFRKRKSLLKRYHFSELTSLL